MALINISNAEEISPQNLMNNFYYLQRYLTALADDPVLAEKITSNQDFIDAVSSYFAEDTARFIPNLAAALVDNDDFFSGLVDGMSSDDVFMSGFADAAGDSETFLSNLPDFFADSASALDNLAYFLGKDTAGVTLDKSHFIQGTDFDIKEILVDGSVERTKRSDVDTLTEDCDGSEWHIIFVDTVNYKVYRIDIPVESEEEWPASPDQAYLDAHFAGNGVVDIKFTSQQYLDVATSTEKSYGSGYLDKTTGVIYSTLAVLDPSWELINTVSFKITQDYIAEDHFVFRTFHRNEIAYGFIANIGNYLTGHSYFQEELSKYLAANLDGMTGLNVTSGKVSSLVDVGQVGKDQVSGIVDSIDSGKTNIVDASLNSYPDDYFNKHGFQVYVPKIADYNITIGSPGTGDGQLSSPKSVVVDSAHGYLYIADTGNSRIQKFDKNGNYITQWPTPAPPNGIALDETNEHIYVSLNNHYIYEYSSIGVELNNFGGSGSGDGELSTPVDIYFDGTDLHVLDSGNNRAQVFTDAGVYQSQFTITEAGTPVDLVIDGSNNYYITGSLGIHKYNSSGVYVGAIVDTLGIENGELATPKGIGTDDSGNLVVVDSGNSRIQAFSATGTYLGKSTDASPESYSGLVDVDIDSTDIYILDTTNSELYKCDYDLAAATQVSDVVPVSDFVNATTTITLSAPLSIDPTGQDYKLITWYKDRAQSVYKDNTSLETNVVEGDLDIYIGSERQIELVHPFLVSSIEVIPYIDNAMSFQSALITTSSENPAELIFNNLSTAQFAEIPIGIGVNIGTGLPLAYIVSKVAGQKKVFLAKSPTAESTEQTWASLGWTTPVDSTTNVYFRKAIDTNTSFDFELFHDHNRTELSFQALNTIGILSDLRRFWYYGEDYGSVYFRLTNLTEVENVYLIQLKGIYLTDESAFVNDVAISLAQIKGIALGNWIEDVPYARSLKGLDDRVGLEGSSATGLLYQLLQLGEGRFKGHSTVFAYNGSNDISTITVTNTATSEVAYLYTFSYTAGKYIDYIDVAIYDIAGLLLRTIREDFTYTTGNITNITRSVL